MSNNMIRSLEEFQDKFEMEPDPDLWLNLISEESEEFLKEAIDLLYVIAGASVAMRRDSPTVTDSKLAEAMGKQGEILRTNLYKIYSKNVIDEAFKRVHESNLSKLGDDGKPIRREDGKIMKGPNYKPPILTDLIYLKTHWS